MTANPIDSKGSLTLRRGVKRTLLLTAAALISQIGATNAAILLIIDVSNPAQVKFTATTAASSGTSSLRIGVEGVSLHNILKPSSNIPTTVTVPELVAISDLFPTQSPATSGGIAVRYNGIGSYEFNDGTGEFGTGNDLGLYQDGGGNTAGNQIFTAGSQAFNGESVWNLSAYASMLPAAGTTGDITSGYLPAADGSQQGIVLGQYTVIPEPSGIALGALATSVLFLRRRRN